MRRVFFYRHYLLGCSILLQRVVKLLSLPKDKVYCNLKSLAKVDNPKQALSIFDDELFYI